MEQFMIDTNAVSHYLSSILPIAGMGFMDKVINEKPNLSIISKIELLCWKINKIEIVSSFVENSHIFNITDDVIIIRHYYKSKHISFSCISQIIQ